MKGINSELAIHEIDKFISMTSGSLKPAKITVDFDTGGVIDSPDIAIIEQSVVVERILQRIIPGWESEVGALFPETRWDELGEAAIRARGLLRRDADLQKILGDDAPDISVAELYPWVWESARTRWQSGHFSDAVKSALIQVNAEAQKKSGRTDISEHDLFKQLFSTDPPKPGAPRLQRAERSDPKTFTSMQEGARALAEALYKGIRNPLNHRADHELSEQGALESLAAISILARWVDEADLVTAEEGAEK